jgi:perosamine synthetase
MRDFINQIEPWLDDEEAKQLQRVIENKYVTENFLTKEFEDRIKELTGSKHAIAVTNGTAALYCCLKSLDIGPGDEVIVPNITFVASSNAVIMAGATPVFCEVDEKTFCIDPHKMKELINDRTKAVMPVHLYGQSCDMEEILRICREKSIYVVEDAAQGVGVKFNDKHVGTFGDLGILSFYGNKTITCGEGGVILTESDELRDRCYQLKNHGRPKKGTFKHDYIGFNFAFTEMQAAIGIAQMNKLDKIITKKRKSRDRYVEGLKGLESEFEQVYIDDRSSPVFWFTSFLAKNKSGLKEFLLKNKIQTRNFFYPLNKQPCYSNFKIDENFSLSEKIYEMGISLPSSYYLTEKDQDYIISKIKEFYTK